MEGKITKGIYLTSIIYILLGIVMIIFPQTTMVMFCYILAGIAGLFGIINLFTYFTRNVIESVYRYDFANGIILLIVSFILVVKADKVMELIPVILGLLVFASGVIKLQHALDLRKIKFSGWLYVLIISFLCLSVGAVCMMQPKFMASTIVTILGISYLFCGITDIVTIILLASRMKKYAKDKAEAENKDTSDIKKLSEDECEIVSDGKENKEESSDTEDKVE